MKLKDIFRYKNFVSLYFKDKHVPAEAHLWNGSIFSGSHKNEMLDIIEDVIFRDVYKINKISGRCNVIIDIGANIGAFSITTSKICNKVYAFEPFPPVYEIFKKNIKLNNCKNIEAVKCAVSSSDGEVDIVKGTSLGGNVVYDLIADSNHAKSFEKYSVVKMKLSTIFEKYKITQVDLMKIDCEGSEGDIISSLDDKEILLTKKYAIEFHNKVSSMNHNEILSRLNELDYSCELKHDGGDFGIIYAVRKSTATGRT